MSKEEIMWGVVVGIFFLIGGIFTCYKFAVMVFDRRDKALKDYIATKASKADVALLKQNFDNMKNNLELKLETLAEAQTTFVSLAAAAGKECSEKIVKLGDLLRVQAEKQTEHMHDIDIRLTKIAP